MLPKGTDVIDEHVPFDVIPDVDKRNEASKHGPNSQTAAMDTMAFPFVSLVLCQIGWTMDRYRSVVRANRLYVDETKNARSHNLVDENRQ